MIKVVNKRTGHVGATYIGRPQALGNPFAIGRDGTREEVIAKYEAWFEGMISQQPHSNACMDYSMLLLRAMKGEDIKLECWCAPLACHGDVIKARLERDLEECRNV